MAALGLPLVQLFGWTVLWVFTRGDRDEDVPVLKIFGAKYPRVRRIELPIDSPVSSDLNQSGIVLVVLHSDEGPSRIRFTRSRGRLGYPR